MTPEEHRMVIERWRAGRLQRLQAPSGWLSLVDRILLEPGDNALDIGTVTLADGRVLFRAGAGTQVRLNGTPVQQAWLTDQGDGSGGRLESGGRSYELMQRGDTFAIRIKDPAAVAQAAPVQLDHFPIDPSWRVLARFEPYDPPRTTRHVYDIGEGVERTVPGLLRFQREGQALALEPVIDGDGRRLFFVFGDATNRTDTYPGGRFLYADLPVPGAESELQVTLDFNLAFNPPCVFTPFSSCPTVQAINRLPVAVRAGERRYPGPG